MWIPLAILAVAGVVMVTLWASNASPTPAVSPGSLDVPLPEDLESIDEHLAAMIRDHAQRVTANPTSGDVRGSLGLVYEANEMWPLSRRCFEQAARLSPDRADWSYHHALMLNKSADNDAAVAQLRITTERHPEYAPAWCELGEQLLIRQDLAGAERAFTRTVDLEPEAQQGYAGLGAVRLQQGRPQEALELLQQARDIDPGYKQTQHFLGLTLRALGRPEEARQALELGKGAVAVPLAEAASAEMQQYFASLTSQLDRAVDLLDSGHFAQAAALLERFRAQRPNDLNVLNNLSVAYQSLKRYDDALGVLERAAQLDPTSFPTQINMAECLIAMGRFPEALACGERAAQLAPHNGQAQFAYGKALLYSNRFSEAYETLKQTARLDLRNPQIHLFLGAAAGKLNLLVEARQHYETAVEQMPQFLAAHLDLCRVHIYLKDAPRARATLEAASRLAPDDSRVSALRRQVTALENP